MKTTLILLSLALAPLLWAADASKILLSGSSVSVEDGKVSGAAKAIVGDMTVAADAIAFEKPTNALRCEGAVTIRVAGNVVTSRDCIIQLSAGEKKLFFLGQGTIQISSSVESRYYPMAPTDLIGRNSDREKVIQDFTTRSRRDKTPVEATQQRP